MREALRRKIGPFPAWAWLGFVFALALALWMRRRRAAAAAAAHADTQTGDATDGGPNTADGSSYSSPLIPASSPGAPASGVLPVDLIVTFQDAAKTALGMTSTQRHAAHLAHQQHLNARRGLPGKVKMTPHELHLLHEQHRSHLNRRPVSRASHATGGAL